MSGSEREPTSGRVVVVVDGPSGSGKSSVGRAVAARLGYGFLSTGAAYRALAWLADCRGVPLEDEAAIRALLPEFLNDYRIALDPAERWVRLGGRELGEAVEDTRVSEVVSRIARVPAVPRGRRRPRRSASSTNPVRACTCTARRAMTTTALNNI